MSRDAPDISKTERKRQATELQNLGKRLAFLVTGATFFGFMAIVGLLYTMYAPRGLRPTLLEGLNAFEVKILPGALMLGSLILFVMFVAAMSRYEAEQAESQ